MKLAKIKVEHPNGQKINIVDIPVFVEENSVNYEISIYLELLKNEINKQQLPNPTYSLLHYLEENIIGPKLSEHIYLLKSETTSKRLGGKPLHIRFKTS